MSALLKTNVLCTQSFFTGEDESIHALVEFVEEDCSTAVVPIKCVLDLADLENAQAGQRITVLWYNRNMPLYSYFQIFICTQLFDCPL